MPRRPRQWNGPDGWTVRVVSYHMTGPAGRPVVYQFFQVRHWGVMVKETNDVDYVKRAMGEAVFSALVEAIG